MKSNDPDFDEKIRIIGNSCEGSLSDDYDADGDGWRTCGGDCDDSNPNVHPGLVEIQDTIDNNCNGENNEENLLDVDDDGDSYSEQGGDCDDTNPDINFDEPEIADGIDNNCNGAIDEQTEYYDDDEDGWTEIEGDCDDTDMEIHPLAEEVENEVDDNCDDRIDEGSDFWDDDGDGLTKLRVIVLTGMRGSMKGQREFCDGIDNDCDGFIDEGMVESVSDTGQVLESEKKKGGLSKNSTVAVDVLTSTDLEQVENTGCQNLYANHDSERMILFYGVLVLLFTRKRRVV